VEEQVRNKTAELHGKMEELEVALAAGGGGENEYTECLAG
jgi:hypothetical protein